MAAAVAGVGVPQVVQEFGHVGLAAVGVDVECLAQRVVHPAGDGGVGRGGTVAAEGAVALPDAALVGPGACLCQPRAIGQCAAEHLVGDDGEREQVRGGRGGQSGHVFGGHVLQGAGGCVVVRAGVEAGHADGAEVHQPHGAGGVDHDVLGPQVLVQDFEAVQGAQALPDLFDDAAHGVQIGAGVVGHPLSQGLALDEFERGVQRGAPALGKCGPDHMGVVDAAGHPFLQLQPFQKGGVLAHLHRGGLDRHAAAGGFVLCQKQMAAAGHVQRAHQPIAVQAQAGLELRNGQGQALLLPVGGIGGGQGVHSHELQAQVVGAASVQCLLHEALGGFLQITGTGGQRLPDVGFAQVGIGSVGGQQVDVARRQGQGQVVDAHLRVGPEGAAQVAFFGRYGDAMVLRELLQAVGAQAVDAAVAHMEEVGRGRAQHQGAEGADMALVALVAEFPGAALCMEPCVQGHQHPFGRGLDAPGVGGAVVVGQESRDGGLAGQVAHGAAADAVSHRAGHALALQQGALRDAGAHAVLVERLAACLGALAHRDAQQRGRCGGGSHVCGPVGAAARQRGAGSVPCRAVGIRGSVRGSRQTAEAVQATRLGAVRTWVEYSVSPTKVMPPTRLPSAVGISFQIM